MKHNLSKKLHNQNTVLVFGLKLVLLTFGFMSDNIVCLKAETSQMLPVKSTVLVSDGKIDASMLIESDIKPEIREALAKIPLGFIPEPLGTLVLPRKELAQKLGSMAQQFDLPQRVQIFRKGEVLNGDIISSKIRELCLQSLKNIPISEIQLDLSRVPRHVVLPGTVDEWKIVPLSTNSLGMRLFQLEATCGQEYVRQLIQVDVCRVIKAAKILRLAKPGDRVTNTDVIETTVRLRTDQQNPPVPLTEVIGKQLTHIKSPGALLRKNDIVSLKNEDESLLAQCNHNDSSQRYAANKEPLEKGPNTPLIKSGDKVEFIVRSGNINMVVPAKALQGGCAGDAIRLINLQNNRQIKGIITPEGKVEYVSN